MYSMAEQEQAWCRAQLTVPVQAPAWRFWRYERAAIILGCSQRAQLARLSGQLRRDVPEVLLRDSGGGAVLAGPWLLGLSLVLPPAHAWLRHGLVDSYRPLGQICVEALRGEGLPAQAVAPSDVQAIEADFALRGHPAVSWACFGSLSPWEVIDGAGRKLLGLAQRRRQHGVLLAAGLLLSEPPWTLLCDALDQANDAPRLRERTSSVVAAESVWGTGDRVQNAIHQRLTHSLRDTRDAQGARGQAVDVPAQQACAMADGMPGGA